MGGEWGNVNTGNTSVQNKKYKGTLYAKEKGQVTMECLANKMTCYGGWKVTCEEGIVFSTDNIFGKSKLPLLIFCPSWTTVSISLFTIFYPAHHSDLCTQHYLAHTRCT